MKTSIFNLLPKSRQKVLIAKDVIKQLDAKIYIATKGYYVKSIDTTGDKYLISEDVKKNIGKIKECRVCSLGACMISMTKYKNKLKFVDIRNSYNFTHNTKENPIKKLFKELFNPQELLMIESAFEGYNPDSQRVASNLFGLNILSKEEENKLIDFRMSYDSSDELLRGIMQNIIRNRGTFKP